MLRNAFVVKSLIAKSDIRPTDTILEIGSGSGNMTLQLLPLCAHVIAIEYDPRMVKALQERVRGMQYEHKLTIIHADVLTVTLPKFDICVANIPYQVPHTALRDACHAASGWTPAYFLYSRLLCTVSSLFCMQISSPLVFKLLYEANFRYARTHCSVGTHCHFCTCSCHFCLSLTFCARCRSMHMCAVPSHCVLMFQREFALRLMSTAGSEDYCRLSISTALLADVTRLIDVDRNSFRPPPKVDSMIVKITPKYSSLQQLHQQLMAAHINTDNISQRPRQLQPVHEDASTTDTTDATHSPHDFAFSSCRVTAADASIRGASDAQSSQLVAIWHYEFDAFIRFCFHRKNKTLRAIFNNKHIIHTLYQHSQQQRAAAAATGIHYTVPPLTQQQQQQATAFDEPSVEEQQDLADESDADDVLHDTSTSTTASAATARSRPWLVRAARASRAACVTNSSDTADGLTTETSTKTQATLERELLSFRDSVLAVLDTSGFAHSRAAKLPIQQAVQLFVLFRRHLIFFHS